MNKYIYGAIIRQSEDGGFWSEVPDLPGCFGEGKSFLDAVESISNGVETHLAALAEYGLPIPEATKVISPDDGEVVYVYAMPESVRLGVPTVSAAEAARMLGVSPARVSHMIRDGLLIAERTVDGTNVTLDSIERILDSPRSAGRPKKTAAA